MERAFILQQTIPRSSNICNNETGNENGKSDFIFNLLKNRIANLEDEISKTDAITDHLTINYLMFPITIKRIYKRMTIIMEKIVNLLMIRLVPRAMVKGMIRRKLLLLEIRYLTLSKPHKVNVQNFPGGTSETILEELDTLVASKPDCIIIHAGTNDLTNGINSLNSVKKIVKKVKQASANTKVVFSSLITRKDKKDLDKKVQDTNNTLKNYCAQTNNDYIDNNNIKEEHLGNKKSHLNKRCNTVFANNLLKYLRSSF